MLLTLSSTSTSVRTDLQSCSLSLSTTNAMSRATYAYCLADCTTAEAITGVKKQCTSAGAWSLLLHIAYYLFIVIATATL